ncbi:hypothetical protein M3212_04770 [Alkalihalobacillus oceani]|uniref:hypothetical protein n=1 Tax=Halalkalibacter oceani TaxID=1653776 RepID=UPI00203FB90D|nr:hypothetical protein [Halalkalibacter oceani]MCM3760101.1 hypothetical protein [Halalkalibacter oceani]
MKREEIEEAIKATEERMKADQQALVELKERLEVVTSQEKERLHYISSKEIIDLIYKQTGKKNNMSTIKRWADEGYLGTVLDEKEKFWALPTKQGKKRFLYPKEDVYSFLYEKGYLQPQYKILDRVYLPTTDARPPEAGIVVSSHLLKTEFMYTIQLESTFELLKDIPENKLKPC